MCTPRVPPINPLKPLYSSVPGPVGITISDLQDTVDVILKLKTEMKEILKNGDRLYRMKIMIWRRKHDKQTNA